VLIVRTQEDWAIAQECWSWRRANAPPGARWRPHGGVTPIPSPAGAKHESSPCRQRAGMPLRIIPSASLLGCVRL